MEAFFEQAFHSYCAELDLEEDDYPAQVQAVATCIHSSFIDSTCTAEAIYRFFGIGDTGFSTYFGHYLGHSVCEYINLHRRALAKRLMVLEWLSMGQIALMVGFKTTGAMSMSFRRHEGCTPSTFKLSLNEKRICEKKCEANMKQVYYPEL